MTTENQKPMSSPTHYFERGSDPEGYAIASGRKRCSAKVGEEYRKYRTDGDMACKNRAEVNGEFCPVHERIRRAR